MDANKKHLIEKNEPISTTFFGIMMKKQIFEKIHTGNLVYNTCWEDPRCDRKLLNFQSDSKIVVITSAGCNALDYLLDKPASVDCVDMNPRQNALLELKCSLFKSTNHETLYRFFGDGKHAAAEEVFRAVLKTNLGEYAQKYWSKNMEIFSGKGVRKSFYYHGSTGLVAFLFCKFLKTQPQISRAIREMFETEDLYQQRVLYYKIEPFMLNRFAVWTLNTHVVQSMLGVPASQQQMARTSFKDGMSGYFKQCLRKVFTELSLKDNYFWKLYFFGKYSETCAPNYLKKENFDTLKNQISKIKTHTNTLSGFLKANPGQYSHFILLDHQDWLAANDNAGLQEEWQLILANSRPNAKILLRSAAPNRNFVPSFVENLGSFNQNGIAEQHFADRVGTYASTHLFTKN
jgi:S-adenosylmethionine-diacylglycerol 3-amino-3-carboxypropyl transferase